MKKLVLLFFSVLILFADNIKEWEKKCDNGDLKACFEAGNYYSSSKHKNKQKSFALMKYACEEGYAPSCSVLGFIYEMNWFGYRKDNNKKAIEMYEKGCKGNDAYGCWYLANSYYEGTLVRKNPYLAYYYWKKTIKLKDKFWARNAKGMLKNHLCKEYPNVCN